ncbi:MAG: chemotaxis response regulator protein-glutamate methylesterase [Rhodocyclaceae bacterium]|nr:chemotaxis response regulator protein-glutamate methylesterase [Rhodocyclaceae bacterium]
MAIKVLVVDDSALMRALLTEIINGAPDLEVVGAAPDAMAAREMVKTLNPDVMTLDVEMPRMDGLEFLSRVMRLRPMPVVMISSFTDRGSEVTLQALELGAVDYIPKPRAESVAVFQNSAEEIREKIRAACGARVRALPVRAATPPQPPRVPASSGLSTAGMAGRLIAIGASTGGTEAIREVLEALPPDIPGVVIVQHMPESFTPSFAKRLDSASRLTVVEARGGERVLPGHAYLAPGHSHLLVRREGTGYVTELSKAEPVNRHRPAVDVLFQAVAAHAGANAIGVILTGMGKDGAQGLLEMRQRGAWTIGQDESTCVVYGMPREAARVGALDDVAPLGDVAARIVARLRAARP